MQVQKRKGFIEDFQEEKLRNSIRKAAKDAGYPDDEIEKIVEEIASFALDSIKDLETVDTSSLRNLILGKLDELYPDVARAWREYDERVKGRFE
jgi:transcriptional regulator NrdR family protein